jgi:hypothetical protein
MSRHKPRRRSTLSPHSNTLSHNHNFMSTIRIHLQRPLNRVRRRISHTLDLASNPPTRQWAMLARPRLSKLIRTSQLRSQRRRFLRTLAQDQHHPLTALSHHGLSLYLKGHQLPIQTHRILNSRLSNFLPPVLLNPSNQGNRRAHM